MIVRDRPSAFQLLFLMRGSILPRIKWQLLSTMLLALAVAWLRGTPFDKSFTLTPIPFSLIGLALAIFLGFRNSASYDRWWEGRKLWGALLIQARVLGRLILNHLRADGDPDLGRRSVRRIIAFTYALKHHLRGTSDDESHRFLDIADNEVVAASANRPEAILRVLSRDLSAAARAGRIDPMMIAQMEEAISQMTAIQGGCERIRFTPLPFAYTLLLHRTAYLYCLALPFGLVDVTRYATVFVVGLISYTFFGLDALGDEIEEPFGLLANDLPLHTISTRIEIDLRDALGETDLPAMPQPVDHCLM
ncbi:putative membrane protein [Faunimonas pinastri]|uniref:Putative membrane protein n=1 Tax=Faunimonas pinastri TaxID=1855383 RepID=A0A1H9KXR1_9HYPH|nr:bestrophin family ion channel [Faunimonas pinastri]SER04021.1 putative membrane protein [Faunimonas pinastri]